MTHTAVKPGFAGLPQPHLTLEQWRDLKAFVKAAQMEATYQINRQATVRNSGVPRLDLLSDVTKLSQFLILRHYEVTREWAETARTIGGKYADPIDLDLPVKLDEAFKNYDIAEIIAADLDWEHLASEPDPDLEREAHLIADAEEDWARAGEA
jgi:hypothetical protein